MRDSARLIRVAVIAVFLAALAGNADALEPGGAARESKVAAAAPDDPQAQTILPQMGLDEALQAFERKYRSADSAGRFHELTPARSQDLIKELSVLSAKLLMSSKQYREKISLRPFITPVLPSRQKLQRWKERLPDGVRPPQVTYQTFAVTLNGKAYVIAPAHGVRGDKRYYTAPKSDTAVRLATEDEGRHALSLERRPSELPGRIVTLEGKLHTGENVRFESAAVRGLEPLQLLLPDKRMSFYNSRRGVEVDYERTQIFIWPAEWSYSSRLKLHRAAGFSGAPAIEKTPQGDVLIGHFTGHRAIQIGKAAITLGILEDYDAIRSAVERFAALPGKGAN